MDGRRFDDLTRTLGSPGSRRGFLKGLLGAGLAAAGLGRFAGSEADAQVTQAQCGNQFCASNPGGCKPGCVCCVYTNAVTGTVTNSRCRPPGACSPGTVACPPGRFHDPVLGCVECLSAANCPGPTDGNPCEVAACTGGICGLQPGNVNATCAPTTCAGGAATSYACDGAGACAATPPEPCTPYVCAGDGTGCLTGCAGDGDCVDGAYCLDGLCAGDLALGATCTGNDQCISGFCTNGVCCTVAACGTCQACNTAGSCAPASDGPCTPSDSCFAGICVDGACFPTGAPRDCPPVLCQQGFCQGGECQYRSVEGEPSCGSGGECFSKVCRGGSCQSVATNELQPCSGGTQCSPSFCQSGSCVPMPERANNSDCPGGICFGGACCQGATREEEICGYQFGTCCETAPCCGGACCSECFNEPSASGGPDRQICCPQDSLCPSTDPNAARCCYGNEDCLEVSDGVYGCIDSERVCGGTLCDGDCCGTDCCEDGLYCDGQACVPVPSHECRSNAECGANLSCVGITESLVFEGDGEPIIVIGPGSCCPANRACAFRVPQGPDGEPYDMCLTYGMRCGPELGQTCDNAYYVACNGCDSGCSPRGSRTRI